MNLAKEFYKVLLQSAGGVPKNIKGLSATQRKAYRDGYANPTSDTMRELLVKNEIDTKMVFKVNNTESIIELK